jgi:hypothetical protein
LGVKHSEPRPPMRVTADGKGLVSHSGTRLLADMAERCGLQDDLSVALSPLVRRRRRHDPGRVLVDLAVMAADGGGYSSDLAPLRDQPALFGPVASQPTAWRLLDAIDENLQARIATARAAARARVWKAGLAPKSVTLDFDATLTDVHTEKENATPTYKSGFGFHPLLVFLDQTHEALAGMLRPGRAGANTAADHVLLLGQALAQLPVNRKADDADKGVDMLVRADSAGATHGFVNAIVAKQMEFSIGFDVTEAVRLAILQVPKYRWREPMGQDMEPRDGAGVAEITDCLDLTAWPAGTRAICRREQPHPGAHFTLFEPDGWRHQVFITCATRRHQPGGMKGPTLGLSQQPVEAGSSPASEARGWAGAALTTTGRSGTARQAGSGKQDGKVYECRNQWWNPLNHLAGSNLVDWAGQQCTPTSVGDSDRRM